MQVTVRTYHEKDREYLSRLFYQIQKEEFPWSDTEKLSLDDFAHSTEGERIFVAEADEALVGFISVWEPDKFIHNLFVEKKYRKFGIGQALLQKVLSEFGPPLSLKCVAENARALNFYQSKGWRIQSEGISEDGLYYYMRYEEV